MADDFITRKDLEKWIRTEMASLDTEDDREFVIERLRKEIPAADVQPVRHGRWGHRWICSNMTGYEYACTCSECGKPTYRMSTLEPMPPYCPNCGAKMDGGEQK